MKAIVLLGAFVITCIGVKAQSIIGTWQLVKQTTCLEENMPPADEGVNDLLDDMDRMSSSGTPRMIEFKGNNTGVESLRMLDKRKATGSSSFIYRVTENKLYILDKKSHTIKDAFVIEKLKSDSLIFSSASRPCELKIFLRTK